MNIEKEFVPYEEALTLKELGFNKPCFGYYNTSGFNFNLKIKNSNNLIEAEHLKGNWCTAPTYSQAFRWFREKYNIQGYIYSSTVRGNSEKTKQFTGYIWNINGIDMPFLSTDARDELHDTYEEAELACLNKLIEIVKDK